MLVTSKNAENRRTFQWKARNLPRVAKFETDSSKIPHPLRAERE